MKKRRHSKSGTVAADSIERQKESLRRTHRQVIYLNDKELAAVNEYCRKFKLTSKSGVFRQATIERILMLLDENHPTLF